MNTKTQSPLVGAPLAPTMIRLAIPGVIGALIMSSMSIVEANFLRPIGTEALAAVAVVYPLIMLAYMFSAGAIGGAVSGAVARALGAGDTSRASAVLISAFVIALAGGTIMGLLVIMFGPALYVWAGANESVAKGAVAYATIVFLGMPLLWLFNMLSSALRGSGDMVRPMIVMAITVGSYVVYGTSLIPGSGSPLVDAMYSAGIANVLAFLTGSIAALIFVLRKSQTIEFTFKAFDIKVLTGVLRQGVLAASQSIMTVVYTLVATALFSLYGTDWLAGYGLAVRLELIMVPVVFGIGSSLIPIVGAYVGAGQRERAIAIAWRGVLVNALIVGTIGLAFALQPGLWCGTLASNEFVKSNCSQSLQIIGPTYAFFAIGLGLYFASQGLNTLIYPVAGSLTRLLIVASGLLWVTEATSPEAVLFLVAAAVVSYGVVVALGLRLGPWRPRK